MTCHDSVSLEWAGVRGEITSQEIHITSFDFGGKHLLEIATHSSAHHHVRLDMLHSKEQTRARTLTRAANAEKHFE